VDDGNMGSEAVLSHPLFLPAATHCQSQHQRSQASGAPP
jgi:hypothetical protein